MKWQLIFGLGVELKQTRVWQGGEVKQAEQFVRDQNHEGADEVRDEESGCI